VVTSLPKPQQQHKDVCIIFLYCSSCIIGLYHEQNIWPEAFLTEIPEQLNFNLKRQKS
jgi:hypothetical protein